MALAVAPFAAQAETWNIYGWQNHSWDFVDIDGGRSFDRISSNAGNIGFTASVDTGMDGIMVNVRCEQFTYFNHFAGGTGWCNRNSKIGLSHPQMGEIMLATWLLPYNEGVAQWVDPFYDAGADSHTSIMGSVGAHTIFYNTGDFDIQASGSGPGTDFSGAEFNYAGGGYDTGFNRRQENIIQYWSPNWNGFVFRFAWTAGNRDEGNSPRRMTDADGNCISHCGDIDPVIRSSSLAYTNGPLWLAVTWQDHEDWTAVSVGEMDSSDAESFRVAGRYIMDMGDGMSVQISAMWEDLEYEFNDVSSVEKAMAAFGYSNFGTSGNLMAGMEDAPPGDFEALMAGDLSEMQVQNQKTYGLFRSILGTGASAAETVFKRVIADDTSTTDVDESATHFGIVNANGVPGTGGTETSQAAPTPTFLNAGTNMLADEDPDMDEVQNALGSYLMEMGAAAEYFRMKMDDPETTGTDEGASAAELEFVAKYDALRSAAVDLALPIANTAAMKAHQDAVDTYMPPTAGQNVKIERDAWMVSGKIKFGGPVDFRFSYMDADDLEVSCGSCSGDWDETAADAWNVGLFYTMPAGTELRLTYSEVDNDDNGTYGQGISGTGLGSPGAEIEMFAVGIVHWFD